MAFLLVQPTAGGDPQSWVDVLRHDVIPVASAYLVFLAFLVVHARSRQPDRAPTEPAPRAGRAPTERDTRAPSWGTLLRYLAVTAAGGYAFFLLIVVVFYFVLGGEPERFLSQALVEGSVLAFGMVIPAFLLFSWIADRGRRV
jgi:hypothetical protein